MDLTRGDHIFRILNPDGQFSETPFAADAPKIDSVKQEGAELEPNTVSHGDSTVILLVTGSGFRPGMAAKWTAVNKEPQDLSNSAVEYVDDKNLKVTLIPGEAGTGVLMLTTNKGSAVTKSLTVK